MPLRTPLRSSPRSSPRSSRKAGARLARACGSPVEALERRQLLTAIINGLFVDTNSPIFEYEQADGTSIRISVEGNLTAEFIGARVPEESTTLIIRDLVPAGSEGDGVNLFSIYIVEADENTTISIAQVPDPNTPERPMQPFQSNAGELNAVDATTGVRLEDLDTGNSTGAVFIGARTDSSVAIFDNIPLIQTPRRRFGLRPSSAGQLFPGIEVAPGNDVGRILIGGTITGIVDIPGNCQFFYAGNILTGDPEGTGFTIPRNFYVGGDLGNLTVSGSIGTITLLQDGERDLQNIVYNTGADLYVGGRLGQFKALDSSLANITVANRASVRGSGLSQEEIEFRGPELEGSASYFDPVIGPGGAHLGEQDLTQGAAAPASSYFNDSFDTAQYLGTLFSTELNANEVIQLRGTLVAAPVIEDNVDYYAVALLGGQTAQVQLLQTPQASIGVFDPDGRLIATDYDNLNFTNRWNKPFRFNADRPGAYRIAIANRGDVNYNGSLDAGESWSRLSPDNYELRVSKAADIALGGLIVNNHIATYGSAAINVERGDLGAVRAGVLGTGTIWTVSVPWRVERGNFRSMESVSMGILEDNALVVGSGPDFLVPRGSVGLLRTSGTDLANSIMVLNEVFDLGGGDFVAITAADDITAIDPSLATGVDIQLVDSASNLTGNLLANRGIGVIRAVTVSSNLNGPPVWSVNVDKRGDDGTIDLVEIQGGALGTLGAGGPAIATGPNGNVRYMRVIPTEQRVLDGVLDVEDIDLFVDPFFGGGAGQESLYQPGEIARLTDDSGTPVTLTPIPLTPAVDPVTGIPQPGFQQPGFLRVLSYPIRDKAGVVIVNVTAYPVGEVAGPGRGVQINGGTRGGRGSVEIGEIELRNAGTNLVFNEFTRAFTNATGGQPADVILGGSVPVDVWSIEGRSPAADTFTGLTSVLNSTRGEIVNVSASHIGTIEGETIGLARSSTGAAVNGIQIFSNTYPFDQQRTMVAATGDTGGAGEPHHIGNVRARRGVANLLANGGSIGPVATNADGRNVRGVHEGVNGPIHAIQNVAPPDPDRGNVINVSIGEGVLSSGTGNMGFAGIYADGIIDRVRGGGAGNDIRGDIVASGNTTRVISTVGGVTQTTPSFIIGDVILTNGAIVDSDIITVVRLADARENRSSIIIQDSGDPINQPILDINSIQLSGIGGIMGSSIIGADVGPVVIDGGFGFISSGIDSLGDSTIEGVIADGYGVRSSVIEGGANVTQVIARGTGKRIDTRSYTGSVRNSERMSFDPYSGNLLDGSNDLHKYLGTTRNSPKRKGYSDAGVIEDTQIVGSRELGIIDAHRIIGRNVFTTSGGKRARIPFGSLAYPMRISFGNQTGFIRTRDVVDGMALITGGLREFNPGNDVENTAINVSGRIQNIEAGGALRGTTSIKATGPEGEIDRIRTKRSLYARIEASVDIGTVRVGTDVGSPMIRSGRNFGTLNVDGSQLPDANITVGRVFSNVIIGRDLKAGATIRADEIVNQDIRGQVLGDIIIT